MKWQPESADPAVGSFMPYLKWAVEHTTGPILELGCGYFSTPYLAELHRDVASYEWDAGWAAEIRSRFSHPLYEKPEAIPPAHWAVVLVDCEGWHRAGFVEAFRDTTQVFVIHDSQDPWVPEVLLDEFEYRADFDANPRTTLVSSVLDVRECR